MIEQLGALMHLSMMQHFEPCAIGVIAMSELRGWTARFFVVTHGVTSFHDFYIVPQVSHRGHRLISCLHNHFESYRIFSYLYAHQYQHLCIHILCIHTTHQCLIDPNHTYGLISPNLLVIVMQLEQREKIEYVR